jgi:hypothetical protein
VQWTVLSVAAAAVLVSMTYIYMCHVCVVDASWCVACCRWQLRFICKINYFCVERIALFMDIPQNIINNECKCFSGPGSSVGIVTGYGLDDPGSNVGGGEIFCTCPDRVPTQPSVKWVLGVSQG